VAAPILNTGDEAPKVPKVKAYRTKRFGQELGIDWAPKMDVHSGLGGCRRPRNCPSQFSSL